MEVKTELCRVGLFERKRLWKANSQNLEMRPKIGNMGMRQGKVILSITPLVKFHLLPLISGPLFIQINNGCLLITGSMSLFFNTVISQSVFSINIMFLLFFVIITATVREILLTAICDVIKMSRQP